MQAVQTVLSIKSDGRSKDWHACY